MLTSCIQKTLKIYVGNYLHPTTLISTTPHVQHAAALAKLVNCCNLYLCISVEIIWTNK